MRKVSGDLHIVDFKTKQIIASIQPEDYFDDLRHWEIKDNVDILDFKLLEDSPFLDYIQQKNLILKETNPGVITPYVITSIAKDSEAHNVTIYASGEWILLDKENYIKPQEIISWSAEQYLTLGITGTGWEIGLIEAEGKRSFKIEKFISPLQFVQQIATLFDNIEIQYRIEIGTGKLRRFIDLVKKRGRETNKEVTLGKDLVGIKRIENSENIITALVPYYIGQDAEGNDKLITIESVNNGSQYIVDDAAFQRWNVNGKHLFGFYTPESEKDELTPARLLTLAKMELKKRVSAIVTYEVNSIDISSVFGYEHEEVSEGDTIRIIDEGMTPTLYLEARAIAGDDSYKDKHQNKHTFGNYVEIVDQDEALRKLYQQMLSKIQDKVPVGIFEALKDKVNQQGSLIDSANKKSDQSLEESKAAKDIADASLKYAKENTVDIIEQATPPTTNLKDGKTLWSDTSDPANKVMKLWKNGAWVVISPDTKPLNTAITQAQQDITKAKQDIVTGQTNLNNAKTELQGNINTEKQRITDLATTVSGKVDQTWIDQQLLDKADKTGVYTKEYIDQNTVGKQTYETDKAGNVQKFSDVNTAIERNATAITSKAEQSSLDTTNNNLTVTNNRVATVEQTADKLTTRIGTAEGKINTATGNISDLQTKTNTIEQTANGSVQKIEELTGRFDGMSIGSVNMIQGTEEIFNNPSATGNFNGFKVVPSPHPKYDLRNKELTISVYFTGKITAKGTNPWLGMELGITFMDNTTQYLSGRIDNKVTLNQDYLNERFVFVVKVNDKEIKSVNVTQGARDLTGSIKLFKGQIEEGNKVTAWKLSPEELTTTQQFTQKTNEIINTVDTNAQKLTAVETIVSGINDNVTNLLIDSGTLEGVNADGTKAPRWYLKGVGTKMSGDNYQGNAVSETQSSWASLCYNFKDLVDRNAVKVGDIVNISIYARLKGLPAGTTKAVTYFFRGRNNGKNFQVGSEWTRLDVETTVTADMMTVSGTVSESYMRFETNENTGASVWFQQSQMQMTIGTKVYTWRPAPEDNATVVKKANELTQTVDSTISRVSAVENRKISSNNLVKASSDKMVLNPKNTGDASDNYNYVQIPVEMQMDREYTVSARITFTKGTDTKVTVYPYTNGVATNVDIQAGGYFTHTFKKTNVNTTKVLIYAGQSGATRDKGCEFTEVMITEGNTAVPYSPPSPTLDEYTQKTTTIEQTATGLRTDINSVSNRVTGVENRAGTLEGKTATLEQKSNTLRSDVDGNISTIKALTETVTYAGENFLDKSSANNEFPSFLDEPNYLLNKATGGFFEDYYIMTCSDYTDSFYQIGSSALNNMHGFKANDNLTLSMDLQHDLAGTQTIIFQHDGTSWSEAEIKTHNNTANVWARVSHSFTLKTNTKGIMIRIRFPRIATSNGKKMRIRKLKLEYGLLPTQWGQNSVEIQSKTNQIKQTTDENSMKLTSIEASGIAGANLVYNTDMLQRPTNSYPDGWSSFNTTTLVWQNPWADEPRAAVARFNRTNLADTDPNSIISLYSNKFPVALNKDYTWSVWMYVPTANWSTFKAKMGYIMEYFNASGTRVQYQDVSLTASEQADLQAGKWTRITRTFRPTTAGITTGGIRLALFHNGDIYYRMPQVELGTVATGWNKSTVDFAGNYQFSDLNSRTNEIKQTLDGTVSSVNSISQTVGQHTTQITQQGTTISQMNNEINLRVKSSEMTDYIANLGAENELRNSAFETKTIHPTTGIITGRTPSLDKWSSNIPAGIGGSIVAEATRNREGYNSAKIVVTGAGTTDRYTGISQNIPATISSGDYVFGAWFYVQDKALIDNGAVIKLQFFNGSTGSTSVQTELAPKLVNNKWVYAEVKVTAPATAITVLRADVWIRRNGTIWVSQPMLQYGSNASAFMEHPQDYVNYDALVGEVAKKVATSEYDSKISTIESSIQQANNQINLRVLATDVYKKTEADGRFGSKAIVDTHESSITLLKNQIISKVEAGGIASAINQTAQAVLIQANKIMLDGYIEAKHLKAQELVGVTIKTAPNGQQRYVKLNQQNIELYDKDTVRAEFRFFNRSDGTAINPSITLGRSVSGGIVGALNITQWTPINAQGVDNYLNAQAAIGMVEQYNSNSNEFTYGSKIGFFKNGQMDIQTNHNLTLTASQQGYIQIATDTVGQNKSIFIEPSLNLVVTAGNQVQIKSNSSHFYSNNNGTFIFENTGKTTGNQIMLSDNNSDADLRLAYIRIRASHVTGYQSYLQLIPTGESSPTAGLQLGNLSYTSLTNRSSRTIKSNIRDLEIDSLEKIMGLKVQQYNFKSDVEKLYQMREEAVGADKVYTTADIPLQYGLVLEDTDETFHSDLGDGINLYTLVSLNVDGTQKIKRKQDVQDERISQLEKEIEERKLKEVDQDKRIATLEELIGKLMNETSTTENTTQTEQP
ncbi:phage tail spike protein [Bacillus cereus]|uniref:phage tail spike protein n=1 Tax=Bacillus cereus TaxID=1396 RepID=UPI003D65449F